jgi:hypothetical protein
MKKLIGSTFAVLALLASSAQAASVGSSVGNNYVLDGNGDAVAFCIQGGGAQYDGKHIYIGNTAGSKFNATVGSAPYKLRAPILENSSGTRTRSLRAGQSLAFVEGTIKVNGGGQPSLSNWSGGIFKLSLDMMDTITCAGPTVYLKH